MNGKALLRRVKNLATAPTSALRDSETLRRQGRRQSLDGVIREHFAANGLGLHNDLQNEHSIVGNLPLVTMLDRYGREDQKAMIEVDHRKVPHHLRPTEPDHGSDATHMETARCRRPATASKAGESTARRCGHRHACRHPLRAVRANVRQ